MKASEESIFHAVSPCSTFTIVHWGASGQFHPATIAMKEKRIKSVVTWQAAKRPLSPFYTAFRKVSARKQFYVSESQNGKKIFEGSSSNWKPKSTMKVCCLVMISIGRQDSTGAWWH